MNYRRATLGLSLLVLGLGLVVWNMRTVSEQQKSSVAKSDYRLVDFRMLAFNEQGEINFSLSAPLLERDTEGKSLNITRPEFTFPDSNEHVWKANAKRAWVSDHAHEVKLLESVAITGPKSKRGQIIEFQSEALSIFPSENRIHSNQWVTIRHGKSILKGQGLEANMKQRRVQLLSKVQVHYAPSR
jgi:LPS export ABC transporter protein LptC